MSDGAWLALGTAITGVFGLLAILLTSYVAIWQKRHIGSSNGNGPTNYMLEKVIWNQAMSDLRFHVLFRETGIDDPADHGEEVAALVRELKENE